MVASQDLEPVVLIVTRRGLCMLKPVDMMLSGYHWSEVRSFGASVTPASDSLDVFVWLHRSLQYVLRTAMAEELEACCNTIINQALGGTFQSRALPKYYPPTLYEPRKDSEGGMAGMLVSSKEATKPERWLEQEKQGDAYNKRHRRFLDAVIANDLQSVMDMVKDKDRHPTDIEYVDINGISALYWAAIMGNTQIVSFLLPFGASVHARSLSPAVFLFPLF